ncbi:MliC family protein [Tropicimonas sp. IMCC34043]|uniref:MliC family protein n=1 Tax=Tropicimonas sp. IMCC34043 TaxID=2248760 RepID=UPI001E443C66|nr:MliC family protein [Tropicimonas sp. IMCC34043]
MKHACLLALPFACVAAVVGAQPSFDCSAAESDAEKAVCATPSLAELDVELARVYNLAVNGPHATPDRSQSLKETQRGWIKGRDACWKSSLGLETCVANEYAFRIDEIRAGNADAREGDGASLGPFAYECSGLDAGLSATFVNTADPMVVLRWRDNALVLPIAISASGSRYASDIWEGGPTEFWIKGRDAMFTPPGGAQLSCHEEEIG